jgi:adenine specific DNA methylase Mod
MIKVYAGPVLEGKLLTKEQLFFQTLECFFAGAEVKGKTGCIRLMQIKSHYYKNYLLPTLMEEIRRALSPLPEHREDIFHQLRTLLSFCLGPRPFICSGKAQRRAIGDQARGLDALLQRTRGGFYYVKTDCPLSDLEIELKGIRLFFDVSGLKLNKSNGAIALSYQFQGKRRDGALVFAVTAAETGRKNKLGEILRQLQEEGAPADEETIKSAVSVFESQREREYYISKEPRLYLQQQSDLWLYRYFRESEGVWSEEGNKIIPTLQKISRRLISAAGRFEEELLRLWNKPKFILKANYVLTLDRIACKDADLVRRLASHAGIRGQIKEWQEMGLVGDNFQIKEIFKESSPEKGLGSRHRFLPIDTKYFKDLEGDILSLFDHLDEQLDGRLIKSENYQALNTILPKFKERVQAIYIDPPFNRGQEPGYAYSVKYDDSAWLTLLENRLQPARQTLKESGCIFVRCDYNGNMYVRLLMDQIFGRKNFKNEVIIKRSGIQKQARNKLLVATDSLFFYSKTKEGKPREVWEPRETGWLPFVHYPGARNSNQNRLVFGCLLEPPPGRHWGLKQELIDQWAARKWVRLHCRGCGYEHYRGEWKGCPLCGARGFIAELKNPPRKITSDWTNIQSYSQDPAFPTRNAEHILKRILDTASAEGDLVMDFFLGSGTTAAAAQKMKRKWIGVEMGDHFYSYALPRMKKVLAGEQSGISKEVDWQGGGFFKYCELEQFEDTLSQTEYTDPDSPEAPQADPFHRYTFLADQGKRDALERGTPRIGAKPSALYQQVDVPGSLSCLTGKWIRRISDGEIEFEDRSRVNAGSFDWKLIKPFIWW